MAGIWQVNENDGFFLSPPKDSKKRPRGYLNWLFEQRGLQRMALQKLIEIRAISLCQRGGTGDIAPGHLQ